VPTKIEKSPAKTKSEKNPVKSGKGKRKVSSTGGLSSMFASPVAKLSLKASISLLGAIVENTSDEVRNHIIKVSTCYKSNRYKFYSNFVFLTE